MERKWRHLASGLGSERTEIKVHDSAPIRLLNRNNGLVAVLEFDMCQYFTNVLHSIRCDQKVWTKWVCNCENACRQRTNLEYAPSENPEVASF